MKNAQSRRLSVGFSLIELLLVIGFIAGAMVLAFVTYPKVQAANRANAEAQRMIVISGGIKNLYGTAHNYQTLTNTVLLKMKAIPDDMQSDVATGSITNAWGGAVVIGPDPSEKLRYQISQDGVPRSECAKLGTSVAVNFVKLAVNGVSIFDRTASGGSIDIDPSKVAEACKDGSRNTMVFVSN